MTLSHALVVGGGIGGLAAATALARCDVAVTVLERSPALTEVGAGLQISPNGMVVLRALGLEDGLFEGGAVRGQAVSLRREEDGAEVMRLDLTRLAPEQPYGFVHRADLVDLLAGAARQAGVTITLDAQVSEVIPGGVPQVVLADGRQLDANLVVAADGLHSGTRGLLNGTNTPGFSGQVAWRATVPNTDDHPPAAHVHMGPRRHLVSYPLRAGAFVNLVAVQERAAWAGEGWHQADDPQNLRAAFAGAGREVMELLERVEDVSLWGLHLHPVAQVWQAPGVALLGDAAHPTLPFLAQGANMALEDAWALAACVSRAPLAEALPAYQALRRPRVTRVIRAASRNAWRYHLRPGPFRALAHTGLRLGSRVAPGRMLGAFDWLYGHDVTRS